jgi:hypothetical protein
MAFVCVQPLMSAWARRAEDLTFDKTDDKDAVLIARLAAQLRCLPEPADETWAGCGTWVSAVPGWWPSRSVGCSRCGTCTPSSPAASDGIPSSPLAEERARRVHHAMQSSARHRGYLARPLERFALLRGQGRVEPYEPHRVCLVEFGDGFS